MSDEDILEMLYGLTHTKDEDGGDVPYFCFAADAATDADVSDKHVAKLAAENGYAVFDVLPGESFVGGFAIVAEGATEEPIKSMYSEFYGEEPTLVRMIIGDDGELVREEPLEEKKRKKPTMRKVGDPNAKAMWGRTRHKIEAPKKGKGSFKRHPKHRMSEDVTIRPTQMQPVVKTSDGNLDGVPDIYAVERPDIAKALTDTLGGTMGKDMLRMFVLGGELTLKVSRFKNGSGEDASYGACYYLSANLEGSHEDGEGGENMHVLLAGISSSMYEDEDSINTDAREMLGEAMKVDEICDLGYVNWIFSKSGLGSGLPSKIVNGEPWGGEYEQMDEAKKKRRNELKDRAEKHRKTDKDGAIGWFIAPNVKQSIQHFNHVANGSAESTISAPAGLGEAAEKHDVLNPKLWNEDGTLKDEVKEKILAIVKEFTDGLEEDGIKFKVDDIVLVGSNCSYNYTDASDLDIHIRMDTDSLECPDDLYPLLYGAYRALFNNKMDIDFYGIPVEIYVETSDTEQLSDEPVGDAEGLDEARAQSALKSNGIYSVLNGEWIKKPVQADIPEVDKEAFNELLGKWLDRYRELMMGVSLERGEGGSITEAMVRDLTYKYRGPLYRFGKIYSYDWGDVYTDAPTRRKAIANFESKAKTDKHFAQGANLKIDPDLVVEVEDKPLPEPKRCPNCGERLTDGGYCPLCDDHDESVLEESGGPTDDFIEEIEDFIEDIYDLRKTSIAEEGEYGIGNLVFKELRNMGYLDDLKELKCQLKSEKLSLHEGLSRKELFNKVQSITEDDVRSWINPDKGWGMTIDPATLTPYEPDDIPKGWFVAQNYGLRNIFSPDNYKGMTAFIKKLLLRYGDKHYIGTYQMDSGTNEGKIAIDPNFIIKSTVAAIKNAIANRQESIYRYDEYITLTHNLIERTLGDKDKTPNPLKMDELDDYGLASHIVDEPIKGCMNLRTEEGVLNTDIPSSAKSKRR